MIVGPKCPHCESDNTETLFQLGVQSDHECFDCRKFWATSCIPAEIIHSSPETHWALTGEET